MKGFLFDQNLPARLIFKTSLPVFASTALGPNPTDSELWEHAKQARLAIVSKDADFSDRVIVNTPPPWVVHLRFGNMADETITLSWPGCGRRSDFC